MSVLRCKHQKVRQLVTCVSNPEWQINESDRSACIQTKTLNDMSQPWPLDSVSLCRPTLAVIDVPKEEENGNDGHGSKIIVIPLDGATLDRDLASADKAH